MLDDIDDEESGSARPFWSGTVAFGLLSLPVNLFMASKRNVVSLRMLDRDGTPLSRRYFCSKDGEPLESDDLVRGYEVKKDEFVEIRDEELEALAPEKSREINLTEFVPLKDIDPLYFDKAYFLVPEEGAQKAYRLLAASMAKMDRAGIATFVMRDKEYLVAIISDGGILRAETLRFEDEIRSPEDIGLPAVDTPDKNVMARLRKEMDHLSANKFVPEELADDTAQRLQELVERKLDEGEDVVHPHNLPQQETAQVIDLMQVLKRSLEGKSETAPKEPIKSKSTTDRKPRSSEKSKKEDEKPTSKKRAQSGKKSATSATKKLRKESAGPKREPDIDPNASRAELYELAKELHIPGRSQMSREELVRALRRH